MEVSVIVPTYNGEKKIPVLLNALLEQTFQDFELIIAVDGSTDNTLAVVSSFSSRFSKMRLVVQENRGRAAIRNRGVLESSGTLLVFFDDDMKPESDSLSKHIRFHEAHPECVLSGNQMEYTSSKKTDIQNYKARLAQKWVSKYSPGENLLSRQDIFLTAANMSVPRKVFDKLNGFDERLTDAEDYALACHAIENGIQVFFDRENIALHKEDLTCAHYINRIRQYKTAQMKLKLIQSHYPSQQERSNFFKRLIYRFFAFSVWPKIIDQNKLIFLPRVVRYKLYDIVIQSLGVEFPYIKIG
ncbi:MAG: glycosyltransferase family 2 protein [Bacteroidetes bacterium]|nr:glycosyltransferase family 2 protein [Bacteroidota bacterium]